MLLLCFTSILESKADTPFYGGDSIKLSIEDIRKANVKLAEIKYLKQENDELKSYIQVDSIIIKQYSDDCYQCNKELNKTKKERNVSSYIGLGFLISTILLLFK